MKTIASLFLVVSIMLTQVPKPPSVAQLDADNGLKEMHFGDSEASLPQDRKLLIEAGDMRMYTVARTVAWGPYKVDISSCVFYKNRLMTVIGRIGDLKNEAGLKQLLLATYGPPQLTGTTVQWQGKSVELSIDQTLIPPHMLTLTSLVLQREYEAERTAADKKAGSGR